ncbi:attP region and P4int integrase [Escherichia coli]|nr:attP region and P4int integrase [Escherichia coli]
MSHTGRMPEVKNRMFTLHPLFTTYHAEIKGENRKVNSVNSSFEKNFFLIFNCAKNKRRTQCV